MFATLTEFRSSYGLHFSSPKCYTTMDMFCKCFWTSTFCMNFASTFIYTLSLGSALFRLVVGASGAPGSVANPLKVPHLQITTLESRWLENCFYCDSRIGIYDHRGFVRLRLCLIVTPDVGHDEGVGGSAVDHLEAVVEQGVLAPPRQTGWRFAWNKKNHQSWNILKLFLQMLERLYLIQYLISRFIVYLDRVYQSKGF